MNITQEHIFQKKQQLQQEIVDYERQLREQMAHQQQTTDIEQLAKSILEYNEIERNIEDRAHVFSLLSSPPESLLSPYVKSELFSYFVSAETVGPELVNFLVDETLMQVRALIQSGEDDSVDLIQAEFKEYVLPGKIIAERFDEIEPLVEEMNRYCTVVDAQYNPASAQAVVRYAFEIALNADIRLDPLIHALRELPLKVLNEADRALLLDHVEERLGTLRFEQARKHQVAMERAVKILERREGEDETGRTPFVDEEE